MINDSCSSTSVVDWSMLPHKSEIRCPNPEKSPEPEICNRLGHSAKSVPLENVRRTWLTELWRHSGFGFPISFRFRVSAFGLICMLLITASSFAADTGSRFDAANKLYEQGKFSEAAAAYEQVVQSGMVSPALYFNLGNAFFKSGQLGEALAAYRHAERIAPRDPELRANLQFVRGQVQGPTLLPDGPQRWVTTLTLNEWTTFAAVVFWLWLASLVLIQFRPTWKQSLRGWLWFGGIATLALCICLAAAYASSSAKTAIVIKKDAVLHNGPLDEAPGGITVHDGAELSVIDDKNDWLQVRIDGNRIGWLKRDQVILAAGV